MHTIALESESANNLMNNTIKNLIKIIGFYFHCSKFERTENVYNFNTNNHY